MTSNLPRGWKKQAAHWCREIIARTPDGVPVTGPDAEFITALLLKHHPDAAVKAGPGVAGFTVATDMTRGHGATRHFVVNRVDGTSTDFSWRECITPSSHVSKVRNAMRNAVEPQVTSFRNQSDPLSCALDASHPGPFHVDHADPSFVKLADAYAASAGGYGQVRLLPHRDDDTDDHLAPAHEETWRAFHQARARLRVLCRPCNLRSAP